MGSSFLTVNWHWEHGVPATGPPGKSQRGQLLVSPLLCLSIADPPSASLTGFPFKIDPGSDHFSLFAQLPLGSRHNPSLLDYWSSLLPGHPPPQCPQHSSQRDPENPRHTVKMLQWLPLALRIKCKILVVASILLCDLALRLPPLRLQIHLVALSFWHAALQPYRKFFADFWKLTFLPGQEMKDNQKKAKRKEEGSLPVEHRWCRSCEQNISFIFCSPSSSLLFSGNNCSLLDEYLAWPWTSQTTLRY